MEIAEDNDERMRKFIVSLFMQSDDVGRLTVKFLRTKFLENLGKDSLEPGRKQRFKEIVHEVFLSFSPKQQASQCKEKIFSPPKKQSTTRRVSGDEDERESETEDKEEDASDVQSSDTNEPEWSPRKKKRRIAVPIESSEEEVDENSNYYKHNSNCNGMKVSRSMKSRKTDMNCEKFGEKNVTEGKTKAELKKRVKNENMDSSGEESVPCIISPSKRKELNRSSSEESDHEGFVEKSTCKLKRKAKKSPRKELTSECNKNKRKHSRGKCLQDSGDESYGSFDDKNKREENMSCESSQEEHSTKGVNDSDKQKIRRDSDNRKKHKVLARVKRKVSDDSSGEDYPMARLKAQEPVEQEDRGNPDFKLNLSKDSNFDSTTSAESDDSSGVEISKAQSKGKKEFKNFSEEQKEKKNLKNSRKTKKRKRSQSSEKARRPSVEAEESVKLRNLKKYVRACGMHVQKYATLFEGCRSMAAKERRLDSYIREETAIEGRITLEKCKKARAAREEAKELAELDTTNIITNDSGRRPRRACQSWYSDSVPKRSPSPTVTDVKAIFSLLKGIVDSDSESGDATETDETTRNAAGRDSSGEETCAVPKHKQRVLASSSEDED